jgi:hypothetical protein
MKAQPEQAVRPLSARIRLEPLVSALALNVSAEHDQQQHGVPLLQRCVKSWPEVL